MARYLLLSLSFLLCSVWGMAQTSLGGKVTDVDTGEELYGANVTFFKEGVFITGTSTDLDGNYKTNLDPGTYDVEVSYIGLTTNKITGVVVNAGQSNKLNVQLGSGDGGITLDDVIVTAYKVPLIEVDKTTSGGIITSEQIRNLPTKDINALAATTAGLSSADEGDDVSVRGSRADGTDYYIDGIRVSGSNSMIPQSEIDQLQVITGGIEAQYGDVTGGIISITTKGPSSQYSGGLELETSEYLDQFGYNLISANISGPILKKKSTGESLLGFRFSGQYRLRKDDDPPGSDIYQVKDEVLTDLEANPIVPFGTGRISAGQFLTNDDINVLGYQPNEEEERLDLTAKLDARITKAIDITLTGSYSDREDRFTPRENEQTGNNWRVFNSHNNPFENDVRYRGNFRFRHNLSKTNVTTTEEEAKASGNSLFGNVQYTLMGGYEKRLYDRGDHRHGENLFDYGYIGQFDYQWDPAFNVMPTEEGPLGIFHVDYTQNFTGYTGNTEINPILANYNNNTDGGDINSFSALNGFFNGNVQEIWDNHVNVGQVYNLYQKLDNDLITLNVNSSFDLNPGGTDKGTHSVQFGIIYEQRFNRGYDIAPRALWRIARQQTNNNILGIDPTDTIGWVASPNPGIQDSVAIHPVIAVSQSGLSFANSVRGLTGAANNEYVNVDALSPSQLSLDMFSAQELNDQFSLIDLNYYGFSYTGEKLSNDVTFDDFFTATVDGTPNGVRTFPVASIQPVYSAAYIQDKFQYKDIIFRLGLRVDRYDANTKVLKDPYSLYEVMTANDFYALTGEPRPDGVEDDYRVYVTDPDSDKVKAFRQGDQWYEANGEPVNDGRLIFGGGVVTPKLYEERVNDIKNRDFDPNTSFEDYEPQVNWMPRMAFSFPISDAANFFAHYDILVQRPSAIGVNVDRATALDYFYWEESSNARTPNANLKPQRTIDYEVGFQQKLSNSSALKIAVYYKEMRDMIQRRSYLFVPAPVTTYETFGNIDFGTVKGFTFQYDLRRTGNVTFSTNYTLQFADGTGSDADGRRGITNRGVIRTLFPLNFDERHRIVSTLDYRYDSGSRYNGPTLAGKDILADFGVNLQAIAVSGRPYTRKQQAAVLDANGTVGQVNGSRLPWNFTLNLRVDKNFVLTKPDAKNKLGLNIYFRVQNLLDAQNIIKVYPLTGSPDDDGYLNSAAGVQRQNEVLNSGLDLQSYLDAYQWRVLNPNFYSLPRRMYLGALFEF